MATNIITAQIKGRSAIADQHAYQYDYGMILRISGVELPTAYQVDFSNEPIRGTAYQQIGNADGVAIPDACFESGDDIFAWVYLHSGEDDGETVYQIMIPVYKRSKAEGETPTPAQQSAIDEAIAALNEAIESADASAVTATEAAAAAAESAAQAATSAEGTEHYAQEAAASAEEAAGYVTAVSQYASQASVSATAAAGSATSANQSAEEADTSADAAAISATNAAASEAAASGSATTAGQKATEAANSATAASGSASAAATSAENAAGSATQAAASATAASQSATAAAGSATAASGSATTASTKADEAAASATSAAASAAEAADTAAGITADLMNKADVITDTASGSIVSIPDGMASPVLGLDVDIEPIQDLHGYDNPWPAGGGKNKLPNTAQTSTIQGVTFTVNSDGTITANGTSTGWTGLVVSTFTLPAGDYVLYSLVGAQTYNYYLSIYVSGSSIAQTSSTSTGVSFTLAESSEITCKLLARPNIALSNLVCYPMILQSTETNTSYAPYSNICPISGRSEVSVTRTGKNLVEDSLVGYNIIANGTFEQTSSFTMQIAKVKKDVQYTKTAGDDYFVGGYFTEKPTPNSVTYNNSRIVELANTFTAPIDGYVVFRTASTFANPQLEVGTTVSSYEPYQGQTVTIQLGQTVYGGTVDVTEGKMTITDAMVDLGTLDWTHPSSNRSWGTLANAKIPSAYKNPKAIAEKYTAVKSSQTLTDNTFALLNYLAGNIVFYYDGTNNPSGTLVYELATPIEVTLTPQELDILYGYNNVWSDANDVSLTYRCDTKKYILKKIAEALNA